MSIRYNKLTFKGKSTADFPFDIYVVNNDGINKAKSKTRIFSAENMSGGVARTSTAYEMVEKKYKLYVHRVSLSQLNELLVWLDGEGKLTPFDNKDRYYEVLTVEVTSTQLDEIDGYEIDVVFTCNPFSYQVEEDIKSYTSNGVIINNSSTIMYPKVVIFGNSSTSTTLTIGRQVVHLKNLNTKLTIECKQGIQNVFDKDDLLLNSVMKGAFFEIGKGSNGVILGQGITKVEIHCRWGEFI